MTDYPWADSMVTVGGIVQEDEHEEVVAWCSTPGCECWSTFAWDENTEVEPGPDDPNLICGFCGCAPGPDALERAS